LSAGLYVDGNLAELRLRRIEVASVLGKAVVQPGFDEGNSRELASRGGGEELIDGTTLADTPASL